MNDLIKPAVVLTIITIIAASALSLTYSMTKDKIEANKGVTEALRKVMPNADQFNEKDGYWEAYAGGNLIGRIAIAKKTGYSSEIQTIVGIDNNGMITGINVISQAETPGLGSKITEPKFTDKFKGKSIAEIDTIDGVTGATISSNAVKNSIKEAFE